MTCIPTNVCFFSHILGKLGESVDLVGEPTRAATASTYGIMLICSELQIFRTATIFPEWRVSRRREQGRGAFFY
jgi:hypothetical protein